jgi:hypothetical protein
MMVIAYQITIITDQMTNRLVFNWDIYMKNIDKQFINKHQKGYAANASRVSSSKSPGGPYAW